MVFVRVIKNLINNTSNAQENQEMREDDEAIRRAEDDEAIRRAFDIVENHERNLVRRLENVRR